MDVCASLVNWLVDTDCDSLFGVCVLEAEATV